MIRTTMTTTLLDSSLHMIEGQAAVAGLVIVIVNTVDSSHNSSHIIISLVATTAVITTIEIKTAQKGTEEVKGTIAVREIGTEIVILTMIAEVIEMIQIIIATLERGK